MFAIDQVAVGLDIEDAAAAFDQFALDAELVLDCFRQTDGLWRVVSLNAVFDRNVHVMSFPQSRHCRTRADYANQSLARARGHLGVLIGGRTVESDRHVESGLKQLVEQDIEQVGQESLRTAGGGLLYIVTVNRAALQQQPTAEQRAVGPITYSSKHRPFLLGAAYSGKIPIKNLHYSK